MPSQFPDIPHLRVVPSCRMGAYARFRAFEQAARNLQPASRAFLENREFVPVGELVFDPHMGHSGLSDTPAQLAEGLGPAQSVDQLGHRRNHAAKDSPNRLDTSSVISLGLHFQRSRATIGVMSLETSIRDMDAFSERIKALRRMRNWQQKEAYEACGVEKTTWNNYEQGTSRPLPEVGAKICDVFGVTLDYLYAGVTAGLSPEVLKALYGKQA